MYDLIIIGSGPAGLSAALYAKRAGLSVLVLEKNPMSGGQILNTYEVDNYLGMPGINGFDMGMKFREHVDKLGVEFEEAQVQRIEARGTTRIVHAQDSDFTARAVVVATGASHRKLNVEGEERLAGRGISYCATCDGAFFRGKTTAVIGGGDVAVEDAIFLARICKKVYVVHRRDELRAANILQEQLFALPNVEMVWNCTVDEIFGEEQVEGLLLYDKEKNRQRKLLADGVFIAVGIVPNSQPFCNIAAQDSNGYLIAGEDCQTSTPGIFAAGDVRTKRLRQVITAVADGACAVASVQEYFLQS